MFHVERQLGYGRAQHVTFGRMDKQLAVVVVSTAGLSFLGLGGMWIATHQMVSRLDAVKRRLERLEDSFNVFKEIVIVKLQALDNYVAKIMERSK